MTEPTTARSWLDRLGPVPRARAVPQAPEALAAAGGTLAAVGVVLLGVELAGGIAENRPVAVGVIAAGLLLGLVVAVGRRDHVLGAAGAAVTVVTLPAVLVVAVLDPDELLTGGLRTDVVFGGATVGFALAWLLPPGRAGRPVHLAGALAGLWLLLLDAVADLFSLQLLLPLLGGAGLLGGLSDLPVAGVLGQLLGEPDLTSGFVMSAAVGLVYLLVTVVADRTGRATLGTPPLAVGIVALVVAGRLLDREVGGLAASLAHVAVGLVVAVVGHVGGRRLSTWFGAVVAVVAAAGIVGDLVDDPTWRAAALLLAGVVIAAAAAAVPRRATPPGPAPAPAGPTPTGPAPHTPPAAAAPPPVPPQAAVPPPPGDAPPPAPPAREPPPEAIPPPPPPPDAAGWEDPTTDEDTP